MTRKVVYERERERFLIFKSFMSVYLSPSHYIDVGILNEEYCKDFLFDFFKTLIKKDLEYNGY